MNMITQLNLFSEHEMLGDLEKLERILSVLPDEQLITKLQEKRKNGRNDYPVSCMWRLFLAKFVFQHPTIESLLRECRRNSQLRALCGLPEQMCEYNGSLTIFRKTPTTSAMSRFINSLQCHIDDVKQVMTTLVCLLQKELPNFGVELAIDGKIIKGFANKKSTLSQDGRRETQADTTAKTYMTNNGDTKTLFLFGYRVHMVVDVNTELPIAFDVTPASFDEKTVAQKLLSQSSLVLAKAKYLMADKGFDSQSFRCFIDDMGIISIIPSRHMWKDTDTRQYRNTSLYYDQDGKIWFCDEHYNFIELTYKGYDSSTDSLRYGFHPKYNDNRVFRIKRSEDYRIFSKVAQHSHKFKRLYNKRSGVERVNGRFDRDFMFENNTVRGLDKMTLFVTMACLTMLGFAYAKVTHKITEHLSSWVA